MTVSELRQALEGVDDDMLVVHPGLDEEYWALRLGGVETAQYNSKWGYFTYDDQTVMSSSDEVRKVFVLEER